MFKNRRGPTYISPLASSCAPWVLRRAKLGVHRLRVSPPALRLTDCCPRRRCCRRPAGCCRLRPRLESPAHRGTAIMQGEYMPLGLRRFPINGNAQGLKTMSIVSPDKTRPRRLARPRTIFLPKNNYILAGESLSSLYRLNRGGSESHERPAL